MIKSIRLKNTLSEVEKACLMLLGPMQIVKEKDSNRTYEVIAIPESEQWRMTTLTGRIFYNGVPIININGDIDLVRLCQASQTIYTKKQSEEDQALIKSYNEEQSNFESFQRIDEKIKSYNRSPRDLEAAYGSWALLNAFKMECESVKTACKREGKVGTYVDFISVSDGATRIQWGGDRPKYSQPSLPQLSHEASKPNAPLASPALIASLTDVLQKHQTRLAGTWFKGEKTIAKEAALREISTVIQTLTSHPEKVEEVLRTIQSHKETLDKQRGLLSAYKSSTKTGKMVDDLSSTIEKFKKP